MKVQTSIFSENEDQIAIPLEIFRMKEWSLGTIGSIMQMFGIEEIALHVTDYNFFPVVTPQVAYTDTEDIPAVLDNERPNIVRVLQQLMMSFGYKRIEALPTEEERVKTKEYWNFVNDGSMSDSAEDPTPAHRPAPIDPEANPKVISESDEQQ